MRLNALQEGPSRPFLRADGGRRSARSLPLTGPQDSVYGRVARLASNAGDAPDDVKPREALQELLRVKDLYTAEPSHLGTFDIDRVKASSLGASVKDVEDLPPPEQRATLAAPDTHVLRGLL